jgi:uncharacterized DUF497 family protein
VKDEWDDEKDLANQRKHGLSFGEAIRLFESDDSYLEIFDRKHSVFEDRFIAIGPIERGLIVVVFTERENDIIRIIGARMATRVEQTLYHTHRGKHR